MQQLFPMFNFPPPCFVLSLQNANSHLKPCVFTFHPFLKVTPRPSFSITEVLSSFPTKSSCRGRGEPNKTWRSVSLFSSAGLADTGSPAEQPTCSRGRIWASLPHSPSVASFLRKRWGNRQWNPNSEHFIHLCNWTFRWLSASTIRKITKY